MNAAATVNDRRVQLAGMRVRAELARRADPFALTPWETDRLDLYAFAESRRLDRAATVRAWAVKLPRLAARVQRVREAALIASMGAPGANVQPWSGVLGFEGTPTGDGRLISPAALSAARLPLPLRWAPIDNGGHDGAQVVGRIDSIERRPDGSIFGRGVLDLGSALGRECARLIGSGMLGGVSLDLDSTDTAPARLSDGSEAAVVQGGRVRAATVVAIPAFADARIALVGHPTTDRVLYTAVPDPHGEGEDCGCDELSTAGPIRFIPSDPATITTARSKR